MKKISVIVPIYNAEKFISKCIESVLNQTYNNVELILVNDGSKDNSLKIIKDYEKKYSNIIKVYNQKNQGSGATRNLGMSKATGEYIVFLDSDDWIKEDYLTKLYNSIGDNDILVSGFERYSKDYKFQYASIPKNNEWNKFKYCATCGKMYKLKFLQKNKLIQKKFRIGEDVYFNINAYSKTKKVAVIEYAGYCHYENLSSVTNSKSHKSEDSLINVLKTIDKEISINNFDKKILTYFYIKTLVLDFLLHKDYVDELYLNKELKNNIGWYKNTVKKLGLKFNLRYQKYETIKINLVINVFICAYKLKVTKLLTKIIKTIKVKLV